MVQDGKNIKRVRFQTTIGSRIDDDLRKLAYELRMSKGAIFDYLFDLGKNYCNKEDIKAHQKALERGEIPTINIFDTSGMISELETISNAELKISEKDRIIKEQMEMKR